MTYEGYERDVPHGWSSWWNSFDWWEAREAVQRESRARILLLGLAHAGKSTLFNRLRGWELATPTAASTGQPGAVEDWGLFCLIDLPEAPPGDSLGEFSGLEALLPLDMSGEADLLVYLLDGAAGIQPADYRWIGRLRHLGTPLVVALNKCDLGGEGMVTQLSRLEDRLATSVLPVSALHGTNVWEGLLPRMMDACPHLAVPLGRELREFRHQAAARLIRRSALFNGLIALEPLPLLDLPLQMMNLVGLVLRIAALYDRPPTDVHRQEVVAAMAGGLFGRYATQQALKFIPFLGWLVSGFIGASCTWLLGQAAVAYFEAGGNAALTSRWQRVKEKFYETSPTLGEPWGRSLEATRAYLKSHRPRLPRPALRRQRPADPGHNQEVGEL